MIRGLKGMTRILWFVLAAAVLCPTALAAKPTPKGFTCPTPSADGCLVDPWPSKPNAFSRAVATAIFTHNFAGAWRYLHPKLQQAISQQKWTNCQKRNPVASAGVKIGQVRVADSKPVPTSLPLLGKRQMRAITLQVLFKAPGSSAQQIAIQYAYWIQDK